MAFKSTPFRQTSLYKRRYFLAYGFMFIVLLAIISIDINTIPNGIPQSAMHTAVQSQSVGNLSSPEWIVNAPFHALQKISMFVFGVSRASLVLPSVFFGMVTIVLFLLTMRKWFRASTSVIVTIIAITSSPFIGMLRSANPDIMLSFWTIMLLFGAVKLLVKQERAFGWKVFVAVSAVGLAYTPLGIYPLVSFALGGLFHPHVRSRVRRIMLRRKIYLLVIAGVLLIPLAYYIVKIPGGWKVLTGWNQVTQTLADPHAAGAAIYSLYISFWNNNFVGATPVPAFNVATIILALLGLFRAIRESYTARSYALLIWVAIVGVAAVFIPFSVELVVLPVLLLVALGLETLVSYWRQLFPRNPYARTAGLVPLVVLLIAVSGSNLTRYFYNNQYIDNPIYLNSLPSIKNSLKIEGDHATTLVTTPSTVDFYKLLQRKHPKLTVTAKPPSTITQPTMVAPEVKTSYNMPPSLIWTSYKKENSVTLRVYRPND